MSMGFYRKSYISVLENFSLIWYEYGLSMRNTTPYYNASERIAAYRASGMDDWAIQHGLASHPVACVKPDMIKLYQTGLLLGTLPRYISGIVSFYLVNGYMAEQNVASLEFYKKREVMGMFLVSDYELGYYIKKYCNYPVFRFTDEAIDIINAIDSGRIYNFDCGKGVSLQYEFVRMQHI